MQGEVLGEWQGEMADFEIFTGWATGMFQSHFGPGLGPREGWKTPTPILMGWGLRPGG